MAAWYVMQAAEIYLILQGPKSVECYHPRGNCACSLGCSHGLLLVSRAAAIFAIQPLPPGPVQMLTSLLDVTLTHLLLLLADLYSTSSCQLQPQLP